MGQPFQVQGLHRWTVLRRGSDCEEGRHVALINFCKKGYWDKLVLASILYKRIVIKFFWTIVNIAGYVIMVRGS